MTTPCYMRHLSALAARYGATVEQVGSGHLRVTGDGWSAQTALTPRYPAQTLANLKTRIKRKVGR